MPKPLTLAGGRYWSTQSAAKKHFQQILHRYRDGHQVTDLADHADLVALIDAYDEGWEPVSDRKAGAGIVCFVRDRDDEHGSNTSCFHIERKDGSRVNFSFLTAVEHISRRQSG